jgi:hypothetical protein
MWRKEQEDRQNYIMRSFILFTIILCDQIKGDEMER